jgi:hypothetical protein
VCYAVGPNNTKRQGLSLPTKRNDSLTVLKMNGRKSIV